MRFIFLSIGVAMALIFSSNLHAVEVPINPVTPDVLERINRSTELIKNAEDAMQPPVKELERLYNTYMEGPCDGGKGRGCAEIKTQIRHQWISVLDSMEGTFPAVQKNVSETARTLGQSISQKTAHKSIDEIIGDISKNQAAPLARGPLSQKLSQFVDALGKMPNTSLLEYSLRTQADLIASEEIIEFLRLKVQHLKMLLQVGADMPILSPEMTEVMKGVGEILQINFDVALPAIPVEDMPDFDKYQKMR